MARFFRRGRLYNKSVVGEEEEPRDKVVAQAAPQQVPSRQPEELDFGMSDYINSRTVRSGVDALTGIGLEGLDRQVRKEATAAIALDAEKRKRHAREEEAWRAEMEQWREQDRKLREQAREMEEARRTIREDEDRLKEEEKRAMQERAAERAAEQLEDRELFRRRQRFEERSEMGRIARGEPEPEQLETLSSFKDDKVLSRAFGAWLEHGGIWDIYDPALADAVEKKGRTPRELNEIFSKVTDEILRSEAGQKAQQAWRRHGALWTTREPDAVKQLQEYGLSDKQVTRLFEHKYDAEKELRKAIGQLKTDEEKRQFVEDFITRKSGLYRDTDKYPGRGVKTRQGVELPETAVSSFSIEDVLDIMSGNEDRMRQRKRAEELGHARKPAQPKPMHDVYVSDEVQQAARSGAIFFADPSTAKFYEYKLPVVAMDYETFNRYKRAGLLPEKAKWLGAPTGRGTAWTPKTEKEMEEHFSRVAERRAGREAEIENRRERARIMKYGQPYLSAKAAAGPVLRPAKEADVERKKVEENNLEGENKPALEDQARAAPPLLRTTAPTYLGSQYVHPRFADIAYSASRLGKKRVRKPVDTEVA